MIDLLLKFFGGGVGQSIGSGIGNGLSIVALAPVGLFLVHNKDEVMTQITYGNAALFGTLLFFVIKIVHYTAPPVRQ